MYARAHGAACVAGVVIALALNAPPLMEFCRKTCELPTFLASAKLLGGIILGAGGGLEQVGVSWNDISGILHPRLIVVRDAVAGI